MYSQKRSALSQARCCCGAAPRLSIPFIGGKVMRLHGSAPGQKLFLLGEFSCRNTVSIFVHSRFNQSQIYHISKTTTRLATRPYHLRWVVLVSACVIPHSRPGDTLKKENKEAITSQAYRHRHHSCAASTHSLLISEKPIFDRRRVWRQP